MTYDDVKALAEECGISMVELYMYPSVYDFEQCSLHTRLKRDFQPDRKLMVSDIFLRPAAVDSPHVGQ